MGREQFGPFAALLMGLTPSSSGSQIALSWKSQIYSLSLCLPMKNRWNMCKRYSGTVSRHPRSPISYPTSRACNLKYGHASRSSRVHSDMSKTSIILPTIVSSVFRSPCQTVSTPTMLTVRIKLSGWLKRRDGAWRLSSRNTSTTSRLQQRDSVFMSQLNFQLDHVVDTDHLSRMPSGVLSKVFCHLCSDGSLALFDNCFLTQRGSTIQ